MEEEEEKGFLMSKALEVRVKILTIVSNII